MSNRWVKANLPREMYDYIKEIIEHPKIRRLYGFTSIADFVTQAVSEKLQQVEKVILEP